MTGPTRAEMDAYIRERAPAHRIDPAIAVRVSNGELPGWAVEGWQSTFPGDGPGGREDSWGPWQFYYGGGLGNAFTDKHGVHASDRSTWKLQCDFALAQAAVLGWRPWAAAKRLGIGPWEGIGGKEGTVTDLFPVSGYRGPVELHWGSHRGASDLFAPRGTPVLAMTSGRVEYAGSDPIGGHNVLLRAPDGLRYYYAHGDQAPAVRTGQDVARGAFLFGVGDSGNAAGKGNHLHIGIGPEILNGAGPSGGAGAGFDAVSRLRAALQASLAPPPAPPETPAGPADTAGLISALAYVCDDLGDQLAAVRKELKRVREQFVGPRPASPTESTAEEPTEEPAP